MQGNGVVASTPPIGFAMRLKTVIEAASISCAIGAVSSLVTGRLTTVSSSLVFISLTTSSPLPMQGCGSGFAIVLVGMAVSIISAAMAIGVIALGFVL